MPGGPEDKSPSLLTANVLAGKDRGKAIADWPPGETMKSAGIGKESCANRGGGSNKERRTYDDYS